MEWIMNAMPVALLVIGSVAVFLMAHALYKHQREATFRQILTAKGYSRTEISAAIERYNEEGWPK